MEELKPGYKTDKQINKFIKNLPEPIIKAPPNGKLIDEVKFVEEVERWLNKHVNVFLHDLINDCTIEITRDKKKACKWKLEKRNEYGMLLYYTDCDIYIDAESNNDMKLWGCCPGCGSEIQKGKN